MGGGGGGVPFILCPSMTHCDAFKNNQITKNYNLLSFLKYVHGRSHWPQYVWENATCEYMCVQESEREMHRERERERERVCVCVCVKRERERVACVLILEWITEKRVFADFSFRSPVFHNFSISESTILWNWLKLIYFQRKMVLRYWKFNYHGFLMVLSHLIAF